MLSSGKLHDGHKQAQRAHRLGKLRVIHRFGDEDVTPEGVAALDFMWRIRRGQDNDGYVPGAFISLETREHLIPIEPRQVQIEQQEQRHDVRGARVRVLFEEVIDRLLAITERDELVRDVRTMQVTLDQTGMTRIVFNE